MLRQNPAAKEKMKKILAEFEDVFTSQDRTVGYTPEIRVPDPGKTRQ